MPKLSLQQITVSRASRVSLSWVPGQIIKSRIRHGTELRSLVLVWLLCLFVFLFFFIYLFIFYHFQSTEILWCDGSKPVSATIVVLLHLAGFLKTYSPKGPVSSNSFPRPKIFSKVAIIKTKNAAIAFFLFSSFPSLRSFFFPPFLFLHYCDRS